MAAMAGIAVALQGQAMGALNRSAGTAAAVALTYGSGGALAVLYWMLRRPALRSLETAAWWYGVAAGILGLIIVGGISYAAPRLGLSRTLVITVAAQLCAAVAIETFGFFGTVPRAFDPAKAVGIVLTAAGVWLVVK